MIDVDSNISKRNDSVSISKGIAIMTMVLAHAQFSKYGDTFITMFHMPLFFSSQDTVLRKNI